MAEKVNIADIMTVAPKSRFNILDGDRGAVLDRGRACSKLTIPSILPDDGHEEEATLDTPYQAVGARLVNNLSSKLLLSLLPPNTSFLRLLVDDEVKDEINAEGGEQGADALNEIEAKLITVEQQVLKQIEREALRVPTFEAIKDLIVTGNSLCVKTETGLKVYKVNNYVIVRDFKGEVVEIITREVALKDTLPVDILDKIGEDTSDEGDLFIFTRAVRKNDTWYEYQAVGDVNVEGSEQEYKVGADKFPYIPLRWTSVNGESYGRGLVEQYLGDFRTLEGLSQLVIEATAVSSRVIFGRRPGAQLDIDELQKADNGAFVFGDLEQDISVLRVEKGGDLNLPNQLIGDITRRLEQAFLVAASVARESERTTATEIRYMASDLEQALGGVYSVLALEFQRPLAKILLSQIGINLASMDIEAIIVTGIEALGRNAELDKLRQFNSLLQELGAPDQVLPRLNIGAYIDMIGNALELDTSGLIKGEEQMQAESEQAQQEQLMQQGAEGMIDQGVQAMGNTQQ